MEIKEDSEVVPIFFDEIIKGIEKVKNTKINFLPFSNFNRFKRDWSGIYKSDYCIITAGSGVGKSKLAFSQYVFEPFNFYNKNSDDIDIRININVLEEDKKKVFLSTVCNLLKEKGVTISVKELKGIPDTDSITNELIEKIKGLRDWFDLFERKVNIYSNNTTTKQIFDTSKKFLDNNGSLHWITEYEDGKQVKKQVYKPKDDKLYFIHLTDHIGLLHPSKEEKKIYDAIHQHSAINNLILKNTYQCQVVDVQQQEGTKDKLDFNYKGVLNEQKNKPSKDGLQYNKSTYDNASQVIGLYSPEKYGIESYNDYSISTLGDSYRYVEMLKSRDGESGMGIDCFFEGAVNKFSELPQNMTNRDYEKLGFKNDIYKFD